MTLETISHCGESWLVGVNGKDVFRRRADADGAVGETSYVGFGNDTLRVLPRVRDSYPCPQCGADVPVDVPQTKDEKCGFCGDLINETDVEALEEGLCRTCLEVAKDGMGFPELED